MNFSFRPLNPFGAILEAKHQDVPLSSLDVRELRRLFDEHHLLVIRNFRTFTSAEDFSEYCANWGEISIWPFGKVLELVERKNPADHIFDHSYVPLHWDGMYRPRVPEIQMFHCVHAPTSQEGGRTTFSHTPLVLERTPRSTRDFWMGVTGIYRREMEYYSSLTKAPIISNHPTKAYQVIRYCEPPCEGDASFINPSQLDFIGLADGEKKEFHRSLRAALYSPEAFYAHQWQSGDVVIADNYTLLHGREAFTSGASRHLRRVHVLGDPALDNPHLVSGE